MLELEPQGFTMGLTELKPRPKNLRYKKKEKQKKSKSKLTPKGSV
jgi:hypothetical protein